MDQPANPIYAFASLPGWALIVISVIIIARHPDYPLFANKTLSAQVNPFKNHPGVGRRPAIIYWLGVAIVLYCYWQLFGYMIPGLESLAKQYGTAT